MSDRNILSFDEFCNSGKVPGMQEVTDLSCIAHPEYYLKEKMAQIFGESDIGERFKISDCIHSLFYRSPRLVSQFKEISHLQHNLEYKGDIALMEYDGNFLIGDRIWVVGR